MATPELSDADVRVLLKDFQVDPEAGGAKDEATRLKLLMLVLGKVQALSQVVAKHGLDAKLNPAALPQLQSRKLCGEHFDINALFSVQDKFRSDEDPYSPWFELRRTLCEFVTSYEKKHTTRLYMVGSGNSGMGLIDIVGAKKAGELPLLELRCQFHSTPVPQEFAAAEAALRPPGGIGVMTAEVAPGELKLAAALLQANAAVLSPEYVSAQQASWGAGGRLFRASCLLPIQPLKSDVKLPKACKVCGAEGAKACSRCKAVSYCGRACQLQDWKRHKAECVAAAEAAGGAASSSAAASGSSSSSSVVVKLLEDTGVSAYGFVMPFNKPMKHMKKTPQWKDGKAPAVKREADASKKFIVKIQAPMDGPPGDPLLLYDEKRKIMTQIVRADQERGTYDQIFRAIRTKGYMGAKLYFNAVLEQERSLRVLLEPLPTQTHHW